jgi:hypothetical protein
MEIEQKSRPYKRMRYKTVGDYLYNLKHDRFHFIIAEMPTEYQMLVFLHEFIEAMLCWEAGIKEKDISAFDKQFEGEDEPGDQKDAPYFSQHQFATKLEKKFCKELGIRWKEYSNYLDKLCQE